MEKSLEQKIEQVVEKIDDLIQLRAIWEDPKISKSCVVTPYNKKQELKQALLELVQEIWR